MTPAVGERPAARAYHEAALHLAEELEVEAMRAEKVLAALDLARGRACRAAARQARDAASRFETWIRFDPPLVQRQDDLALWYEVIRISRELSR
jgi:hypothetical protein